MQIEKTSWSDCTRKFMSATTPKKEEMNKERTQDIKMVYQKDVDCIVNNSNEKNLSLRNGHMLIGKRSDHSCRNILMLIFVLILAIFCFDVHREIIKLRQQKINEQQQCFSDFVENQCELPIEILATKCKQLEKCANVVQEVKAIEVIARLAGQTVKIFIESSQMGGTLIALILMIIMLVYAYKASKQQMIVKKL